MHFLNFSNQNGISYLHFTVFLLPSLSWPAQDGLDYLSGANTLPVSLWLVTEMACLLLFLISAIIDFHLYFSLTISSSFTGILLFCYLYFLPLIAVLISSSPGEIVSPHFFSLYLMCRVIWCQGRVIWCRGRMGS